MGGGFGFDVGVGLCVVWQQVEQVKRREYSLKDFNWLQFVSLFLRKWHHLLHLLHLTEGKFVLMLLLHTQHTQPRPGMGPGLGSIPACSRRDLTTAAGMWWSSIKNLMSVGPIFEGEEGGRRLCSFRCQLHRVKALPRQPGSFRISKLRTQ